MFLDLLYWFKTNSYSTFSSDLTNSSPIIWLFDNILCRNWFIGQLDLSYSDSDSDSMSNLLSNWLLKSTTIHPSLNPRVTLNLFLWDFGKLRKCLICAYKIDLNSWWCIILKIVIFSISLFYLAKKVSSYNFILVRGFLINLPPTVLRVPEAISYDQFNITN